MVFWWTQRGYLALLTTIGVVGVFGAVVTLAFGEVVFDRFPWLWTIAFWLAAAATWVVGSRINRRPIEWNKGERSIRRLIYKAPNRFVSLPVETWAIPLLGIGLVVGLLGVFQHSPQ